MTITTPTNAAAFNAGDRLQIAHDPLLSPSGSWTIEAWIATDDADAEFNRIIRQGVGGGQTYSLLVKDGQAHIRYDGGGAQVLQAGPNIADGLLHHLAGVYDADNDVLILYVDGTEVGRLDTTGSTPVQGTDPVEIGSLTVAPHQFFDGAMHEVRVWSEARTHRDILEGAEGVDPGAESELQLQLTFPDGVPEDQSTNAFEAVTANGTLDPASALVVDDDVFTPLDGVSVDFGDPASGVTLKLSLVNLDILFDPSQPGLFGLPTDFVDGQVTGVLFSGPEASVNALLASIEIQPLSVGGASIRFEANTVDQTDTVTETIVINGPLDVDPISLVVTTLEDVVDITDGEVSLREALALANAEDDALGDGIPDEITFADDLQGGTLQLASFDTLTISDDLTIRGNVSLRAPFSGVNETVVAITDGVVTLEGLTIGNSGRGLYVGAEADVTLRDVEVSRNFAESRLGGGISSLGDLSIYDSRIVFNTTGASGGGILQDGGSLTIRNTEIGRNSISNASAYTDLGAAGITLTNGATGTISNALFADNRAGLFQGRTGGLQINTGSSASVVNTTFYANRSDGYDGVGSILNDGGSLSLTHVTVTAGLGSQVGGVQTLGTRSSTVIRNSILLGNSRESDGFTTDLVASGALTLQGGNIHSGQLFDGSTVLDPIVLASEVFDAPSGGAGVLADNGGNLETVLLLAHGVAADVAVAPASTDVTDVDRDGDTTEALPIDARGQFRIVGTAPDLGALELSQPGPGDDIVFTTSSNRTATGEGGADVLYGGSDSDALFGGEGPDALYGGPNNDTLSGGSDADVFVFAFGDGLDEVTDFEVGTDLIDLRGLSIEFEDLVITDDGGDARVAYGPPGQDEILLSGVAPGEVTEELFLFDRLFAETGFLTLTNTPQVITLERTYENPVAVAFVATENGADPVDVRVSAVTGDKVTLRLQEPNYLDGNHGGERVNYMVVEAGTWILPDGTLLEAGTVDTPLLTSQGFQGVSFAGAFDQTPVILSQVQTLKGQDFVSTRQRQADRDGFEVAMQEDEATNGGNHTSERLGWVAIEAGSGTAGEVTWAAGNTGGVSDAGRTVDIGQTFAGDVNAIANLASFIGADPAWARGSARSPTSFDVSAEEDQSRDTETAHANEAVDWFAFEQAGVLQAAPVQEVFETGFLTLTNTPQVITLERTYENPVAVAFVATENGADPVDVRVSAVTGDKVTLRLQEPNYLDGNHGGERVNYMVVEAGTWILPDGTLLEAGTVDTPLLTSQGFQGVSFAGAFDQTPVILSQVQTLKGQDFVSTRQRQADRDGFEVAMQEDEATNGGNHTSERLGWVAIEAGSGTAGEVTWAAGNTGGVSDAGRTVDIGQTFAGDVNAIANLASFIGADPAWARGSARSPTSFDVSAEEDQSRDTETAHANEAVDWFAFEQAGLGLAYDADLLI